MPTLRPTPRVLVGSVLGLLVLEQLLRAVHAVGSLGGIFDGRPSWAFDYPLMTYVTAAGARIHAETGHLWGYEPHFMAGYPLAYLEHNLYLYQLIEVALPSLPPGLLLRLAGLAATTTLPLLLYGSLRLLDIAPLAAVATTAMGMGLLTTSEFSVFVVTHPIPCGWAPLLLLPLLGVAVRHAARPGTATTLALLLGPAFALAVHKSAIVVLPVPLAIAALVLARRGVRTRVARDYVLGALVAALANLAWILPLARYLGVRHDDPPPFWLLREGWSRLFAELASPVVGFVGFDPSAIVGEPLLAAWGTRLVTTLIGAAGVIVLLRRGRGRLALVLGAVLLYLAALTYVGSRVGWIARTEPYRYVVLYRMAWLLPAGFAIQALLERDDRRVQFATWALVVALALAPFAGASHVDLVAAGSMSPEEPPAVARLERWVREEAPARGRLMVEDAWARFEDPSVLANSYPLGMIALRTDRELIGGRVPYFRVPHRFASFVHGEAFGFSAQAQHPDRIRRYLELYDVTAIAAWHPGSVAALDRMAAESAGLGLHRSGEAAPWAFYRVEREADRFERGRGRVTARWGALELEDVEAAGGEVVLRQHWMEGMRSEPPAELEPVWLEDDPVPFVRIVNPPPRMRITVQ